MTDVIISCWLKRDSPSSYAAFQYNVVALSMPDELAFMRRKKGSNKNYSLSRFGKKTPKCYNFSIYRLFTVMHF